MRRNAGEDERVRDLERRALAGDEEAARELVHVLAAQGLAPSGQFKFTPHEVPTRFGPIRVVPHGIDVIHVFFGRPPGGSSAEQVVVGETPLHGQAEYFRSSDGRFKRDSSTATIRTTRGIVRLDSGVARTLYGHIDRVVAAFADDNPRLLSEAERAWRMRDLSSALEEIENVRAEAERRVAQLEAEAAAALVAGLKARELSSGGLGVKAPPRRGRRSRSATAAELPRQPVDGEALAEARRVAADEAFENHEFDGPVEAFDGWEWSTGSDDWDRTVYLADPQGGDSRAVTFTVTFRPGTADVLEAS